MVCAIIVRLLGKFPFNSDSDIAGLVPQAGHDGNLFNLPFSEDKIFAVASIFHHAFPDGFNWAIFAGSKDREVRRNQHSFYAPILLFILIIIIF
jgi:hypothetical protein